MSKLAGPASLEVCQRCPETDGQRAGSAPCTQTPARPAPGTPDSGQWAGQGRRGQAGLGVLGGLGTRRLRLACRKGVLRSDRGCEGARPRRGAWLGSRESLVPSPSEAPESEAAPTCWPRGSCREQVWGVLKAGIGDTIPFGSEVASARTAINTDTADWGGGGIGDNLEIREKVG